MLLEIVRLRVKSKVKNLTIFSNLQWIKCCAEKSSNAAWPESGSF